MINIILKRCPRNTSSSCRLLILIFNYFWQNLVCLEFYDPLWNFSNHMETLSLSAKGCKWPIQCTRHSWLFRSVGSLLCHTYCEKGHPIVIFISLVSWHSHLLLRSGAVATCINDLGLSWLEFEHPTFQMRGQRSNRLLHHCGHCVIFQIILGTF